MADILVVAEIVEGQVKKATFSAVAFARESSKALGGGFDILAVGAGAEKAAAELGQYGAKKVLVADDASLKGYTTERFAPIVAAAGKAYRPLRRRRQRPRASIMTHSIASALPSRSGLAL